MDIKILFSVKIRRKRQPQNSLSVMYPRAYLAGNLQEGLGLKFTVGNYFDIPSALGDEEAAGTVAGAGDAKGLAQPLGDASELQMRPVNRRGRAGRNRAQCEDNPSNHP